jgi:hypothetical protein
LCIDETDGDDDDKNSEEDALKVLSLAGRDEERIPFEGDPLFVEATSKNAETAVLLRLGFLQLRSIGSVCISALDS